MPYKNYTLCIYIYKIIHYTIYIIQLYREFTFSVTYSNSINSMNKKNSLLSDSLNIDILVSGKRRWVAHFNK